MEAIKAYAILDLKAGASHQDAEKAYIELSTIWSPSNNKSSEAMLERARKKTLEINEAYATILEIEKENNIEFKQKINSNEVGDTISKNNSVENGPKKIRIRNFSIGGIIIAVIVSFIVRNGVNGLFQKPVPVDNVNSTLTWISQSANRTLPANVDKETSLVITTVGPGKKFTYIYSIKNYTKDEIDMSIFKSIEKQLINSVKTSTDSGIKYFRENNITLDYIYDDKNGSTIQTIELLPSDYN